MTEQMDVTDPEWVHDCLKWRGKVLTGKYAHWCEEWDCLPVDETTPEFPCLCFSDDEADEP